MPDTTLSPHLVNAVNEAVTRLFRYKNPDDINKVPNLPRVKEWIKTELTDALKACHLTTDYAATMMLMDVKLYIGFDSMVFLGSLEDALDKFAGHTRHISHGTDIPVGNKVVSKHPTEYTLTEIEAFFRWCKREMYYILAPAYVNYEFKTLASGSQNIILYVPSPINK